MKASKVFEKKMKVNLGIETPFHKFDSNDCQKEFFLEAYLQGVLTLSLMMMKIKPERETEAKTSLSDSLLFSPLGSIWC